MKPKIILSVPYLAHALKAGLFVLHRHDRIVVPLSYTELMEQSIVVASGDVYGWEQWPTIIQQHMEIMKLLPCGWANEIAVRMRAGETDEQVYKDKSMAELKAHAQLWVVTNLSLEMEQNAYEIEAILQKAAYDPFNWTKEHFAKVTAYFEMTSLKRTGFRCDDFELFPNSRHLKAMGLCNTKAKKTCVEISHVAGKKFNIKKKPNGK